MLRWGLHAQKGDLGSSLRSLVTIHPLCAAGRRVSGSESGGQFSSCGPGFVPNRMDSTEFGADQQRAGTFVARSANSASAASALPSRMLAFLVDYPGVACTSYGHRFATRAVAAGVDSRSQRNARHT